MISGKAYFVLALSMVLASLCQSQSNLRSVVGVVTDNRGNTLPGSVVELEDTVTLMIRSFVIQKDGRYHFSGLDDNVDYKLAAKYRDHWSKSKMLSRFNSSKQPEVNLIIPIE